MNNNRICFIYAKALYQSVRNSEKLYRKENEKNEIEYLPFDIDSFVIGEELILLSAIMISSSFIRNLFKNPTFSEEEKLDILLTIFPGLTSTSQSFLKLLTERRHLKFLTPISEEYSTILEIKKSSTKVKMIIARSVTDRLGEKILKSLQNLTKGKEILLNIIHDPRILGGFILEYKSIAVDISLLKQFNSFVSEI
jgi:ATP synthase F1 delta subunit